MTSVFLATPTTRDLSVQYVTSLWQTQIRAAATWMPVVGQALDVGRNILVERFLKSGMDFLLMHDSDATWNQGAVQRLVDRNLPVVTAVIFQRKIPTVPTIGIAAGKSPEGHQMYGFTHTINRVLEKVERDGMPEDKNELLYPKSPDDLEEIDGAGAHFMLIRRDVVEAIRAPWYQNTSINAGEDFYFCRQVKAAGIKMYVDYSVFTGHVVGPGLEIGIRQFLMFRDKVKLGEAWIM